MRTLHIKGIEIIDDPSVPDGEVWILCPMATGGKIRYMFNLLDHRMTQPGANEAFLLSLERWLEELETGMQSFDEEDLSLGRLGLILEAIKDFKSGKDARTIPDDR
jgi:hypothetical protein